MLLTIILVVVCVSALVVLGLLSRNRQQRAKRPPGPRGPPFFGQFFKMDIEKAFLHFTDWNKEYGDIFMLTLMGKNILVINGPDLIKKCFDTGPNACLMNGRPPSFLGKYAVYGYKDILLRRNDDTFRKLKKSAWDMLIKHCDSSDSYEERMREEMTCMLAKFLETEGENIDPMKILFPSICVLTAMMFTGKRLNYNDQTLKCLMKFDACGDELVQFKNQSALNTFPLLRQLPGKLGDLFQRLLDCRTYLFQQNILQMKDSYNSAKVECFTHSMFQMQQEVTEAGGSWLTDEHIHGTILDIINTSAHTSKGMISGCLLLLLNLPEVGRRIQKEVDDVIGHTRLPALLDMDSMPYTHASILELFRYQTHVPISAPHYNCDDEVEVEGYTIPQNTVIFGNYWASNHDERFWEQPWEFQPERFLDETGVVIKQDDLKRQQILSFGVGERFCLGHMTATYRLFMYITTLLQNFDLVPPDGTVVPSADPRSLLPGKVLIAPTFICKFLRRNLDQIELSQHSENVN